MQHIQIYIVSGAQDVQFKKVNILFFNNII